ncbi:hypothetical protein TAMA11512_06990 [Selenomonas sp. TAMA-11512]|uniref:hypothetical protein n=1 Tax=Selenomonas sp. TAMA-11512 TaxID=3095337 RepID=UPI00309010B8|nr:hypothetical protein TAMA11512_06990 [Selenomonas sp. TAMA-11512]
MKRKRLWSLLFIFVLAAVLTGCYRFYQTQQVEYTAGQIAKAIETRDAILFDRYVDTTRLAETGYDAGSRVLSEHVAELHELYPEDPFFWHDTAFMTSYTAEHRMEAIRFIREGMHRYFIDTDERPDFAADPTGFVAHEAAEIVAATEARVVEKREERDGRVVLRVRFDGAPTSYGELSNDIEMELLFEKDGAGDWKAVEIVNAEELLLPVTASAEAFWTMQGWQ